MGTKNKSEIDKSTLLRAIESIKARGEEPTVLAIAKHMDVAISAIYDDLALLLCIYKASSEIYGVDALIYKLIKQIKLMETKSKSTDKKIQELESTIEKSYSDGFTNGAAIKFSESKKQVVDEQNSELLKIWAAGVLNLELKDMQDQELIKKAYRKLASLMHPDQNATDTKELMHRLNYAYELLNS